MVHPHIDNMLIEFVESVDHPCTLHGASAVLKGKVLKNGDRLVEDTYVVETGSGDMQCVNIRDLRLNEDCEIQAPWHGNGVLLVTDPARSTPLRDFLSNEHVPGLMQHGKHVTFMSVFETYRMYGICILFFGGAVRTALLQNSMLGIKDVDVIFGTSPSMMIEIGNETGMGPISKPLPFKVQWGSDRANRYEATMEGAPMCPDRNPYSEEEHGPAFVSNSLVDHLVTLDFTCNSVVYEPLTDTFIDVSGKGIWDTLQQILRIPAKQERWNEWVGDNGLKLLRYWKMKLFGFQAADQDTHTFVVEQTLIVVPKMPDAPVVRFLRSSVMHGKPPSHRIAREELRSFERCLRQDIEDYMATAPAYISGRLTSCEAHKMFVQFWERCTAEALMPLEEGSYERRVFGYPSQSDDSDDSDDEYPLR